jgi:NAD(P)-dependent dehydrogenase (short-subunit alcohol dehydrogenase family)
VPGSTPPASTLGAAGIAVDPQLRHSDAAATAAARSARTSPHDADRHPRKQRRIKSRGPIDTIGDADWTRARTQHSTAPSHRAGALPGMQARRRGTIINLARWRAAFGRPNIVAYAVTKGGHRAFTRALAVEGPPFRRRA